MSQYWFDEVKPGDRHVCFRFGSSALPCGPPYRVRVTQQQKLRGPEREVRRVVCRLHYEAEINKVPGGLSGIKSRASTSAADRLIGAHHDEFQQLFDEELAKQLKAELPYLRETP